jgi:hypothetical protein
MSTERKVAVITGASAGNWSGLGPRRNDSKGLLRYFLIPTWLMSQAYSNAASFNRS